MNLGASAIVLRPRPLSEVLDLACRLSVSLAFGLYARLVGGAPRARLRGLPGAALRGSGGAWAAVWACRGSAAA